MSACIIWYSKLYHQTVSGAPWKSRYLETFNIIDNHHHLFTTFSQISTPALVTAKGCKPDAGLQMKDQRNVYSFPCDDSWDAHIVSVHGCMIINSIMWCVGLKCWRIVITSFSSIRSIPALCGQLESVNCWFSMTHEAAQKHIFACLHTLIQLTEKATYIHYTPPPHSCVAL